MSTNGASLGVRMVCAPVNGVCWVARKIGALICTIAHIAFRALQGLAYVLSFRWLMGSRKVTREEPRPVAPVPVPQIREPVAAAAPPPDSVPPSAPPVTAAGSGDASKKEPTTKEKIEGIADETGIAPGESLGEDDEDTFFDAEDLGLLEETPSAQSQKTLFRPPIDDQAAPSASSSSSTSSTTVLSLAPREEPELAATSEKMSETHSGPTVIIKYPDEERVETKEEARRNLIATLTGCFSKNPELGNQVLQSLFPPNMTSYSFLSDGTFEITLAQGERRKMDISQLIPEAATVGVSMADIVFSPKIEGRVDLKTGEISFFGDSITAGKLTYWVMMEKLSVGREELTIQLGWMERAGWLSATFVKDASREAEVKTLSVEEASKAFESIKWEEGKS